MSVFEVTRINPQPLLAVPVGLSTAFQIAALFGSVMGRYSSNSQTGAHYPGGWRLTIQREEYPDQTAYPGDWLLVTDATFNVVDGAPVWETTPSTEVTVYGASAGLPGTADDFVGTFMRIDGLPLTTNGSEN